MPGFWLQVLLTKVIRRTYLLICRFLLLVRDYFRCGKAFLVGELNRESASPKCGLSSTYEVSRMEIS